VVNKNGRVLFYTRNAVEHYQKEDYFRYTMQSVEPFVITPWRSRDGLVPVLEMHRDLVSQNKKGNVTMARVVQEIRRYI
jgi:hypothetical protein